MAKTAQMELDFNLTVKSSWKLKRRRYVCKEGRSYLAVCDSVGQLQASVRAGRSLGVWGSSKLMDGLYSPLLFTQGIESLSNTSTGDIE